MITLTIDSLSVGGDGVGRHDGLVVFVPGSAPGDVLSVIITEKHKNFWRGEIAQVLTPSPKRIPAPCPVAGLCGGCPWQHIERSEQLAQKEAIVFSSLKKALGATPFKLEKIIPSPREFRYRNRIQPQIKNKKIGFYKRGTREVLEISDCLIAEKAISDSFKDILAAGLPDGRIEIRLAQDERVEFKAIASGEFEGLGFSQVNRFQNEQLVNDALQIAEHLTVSTIFDLYAGSGNFSIPLAKRKSNVPVVAVELSTLLVQNGRKNIEGTSVKNLSFIESDVDTYLKRTTFNDKDLLLVDPPRDGLSRFAATSIAETRVKQIIYISCHPVTLARDLKIILDKRPDLKIEKVIPYEMFPQTDHVETLVFLKG